MKSFLVYGLSNDWGGLEAIVITMIRNMASHNRFDIILSNEVSTYEKKYQSDHIRFLHIPSWGSDKNGFANGLMCLLRENDYDYVWVNGCLMSNKKIISVTKKYSKAKIISHSHGSSFEEKNKIKRFILLVLHYMNRSYYKKNIDFPCMCSYKSGLWFYGESFLKLKNVLWVKNGVDISLFQFDLQKRNDYRRALGIQEGTFAVFHVGRLTPVKNQQKLLSIFTDFISSNNVSTHLFIAGDGEL